MEVWGLFAFVVVFILWDKIRRLERILRENDIRPVKAPDPGGPDRCRHPL